MRQDMQRRAALIQKRLPEVAQETIRRADMYLRGEHILPGTGAKPLFVGNPVDWTDNKVGDKEYLWQLNRMTHWQPLLAAYALTREEKYAKKVLDELAHWVKTVPAPQVPRDIHEMDALFSGPHPWRILEVGIRAYKTFPLLMDFLADDPLFSAELQGVYRNSLLEHARLLEEVSPLLWPNADHNHFLMEMLGLLSAALLFPQEQDAPRWKETAIHQLERCSAAQLTEGGGQIEGCPMYHNGCMFWFGHSLLLAARYGFSFSKEYVERYRRALDYSVFALRPNGEIISWGDSKAQNNAPLAGAYGYGVFRDMRWFHAVARYSKKEDVLREISDHLWRLPDLETLLEQLEQPAVPVDLPCLNWQKTLKQVFLRSGWDKDDVSVMFACRTPIQNLHAHIDPMGFDLSALGKPLLVDPGIVTYQDNELRYQLKSPAYHNTLTVNRRDHFAYQGSFAYGAQKYGEIYDAAENDRLRYAAAVHIEYAPVVHRRALALVDGAFVVVLDRLEGLKPEDSVQIYYHFNSVQVQAVDGGWRSADEGANIAVYPTSGLRGTLLEGIVGERVDVWHASTRLELEDAAGEETRAFAAVLCPFRGKCPVVEGLFFDGKDCTFSLDDKAYHLRWDSHGVHIIEE
mgnify:CR=1 FL=1